MYSIGLIKQIQQKMTILKERDIENYVEQILTKKGYNCNFGDANRNVYMQRPKTENEVKKLKGKEPDFIIYIDNETIIIETKNQE